MDYRVREKVVWAADLVLALVLIIVITLSGLLRKYWWAAIAAIVVVGLACLTFFFPGVWFNLFSRIPWGWIEKIWRVIGRWFAPG